jgi:predicted phosphodiesterase
MCLAVSGCRSAPPFGAATASGDKGSSPAGSFSFAVAGDMRNFAGSPPAGKRYFDGACEALKTLGSGAFMLSPGDCDPPGPVRATIDRYLGTNYLWYPVAGNHETENARNMNWLRGWSRAGIPHLVRRGPPGAEDTTYSFDVGDCHFVMLNEYYDGRADTVRRDDLPEASLQWLEQDLAATHQGLIWVMGHKPIESIPDMDSGRLRHAKESVSTNPAHLARFVELLKRYRVRAYLCGHTHNASVVPVKGIWQVDSGHARGGGDTGAPSTFMKVCVSGNAAWVEVYRADVKGEHYRLRKTVKLTESAR